MGADPEVRYLPSGGAVTNISVATSEGWKDKDSGEMKERTEWHRIVFFNRLAEIAGEYLKKGSKVFVEGRLQTRKWQDKDGHDRYSTEIIANEMQMLDGKGGSVSMDDSSESKSSSRSTSNSSASKPAPAGIDDSFDDDIPF